MSAAATPLAVAGLGVTELLIILGVLILLFGARKLPELARGSGRALRIFKAETKGLVDDDDDKYKTDEQKQIEAQNRTGQVQTGQTQSGQPYVEPPAGEPYTEPQAGQPHTGQRPHDTGA